MPSFFYNQILALLFPEHCLGCRRRDETLCHACIQGLGRCTRALPSDIFAAFDYHDPIVKKAIWNIKYYNHSPVGPLLGKIMYETLLEDIAEIEALTSNQIVVVPIPLSARRYKERGYNQAEKIARGFVEAAGTKSFILNRATVHKHRDISPQARIIEKNERLKNIRGAFTLTDNRHIKGRTVIVIDDVTTTGGTMQEVMKVLKEGGAKKVYGFTVAH